MKEPVQNTCPLIDGMLEDIRLATKSLDFVLGRVDDELKEEVSEIINCLRDFPEQLEELRYANSALRAWGNEMVNLVTELENKLELEVDLREHIIGDLEERLFEANHSNIE